MTVFIITYGILTHKYGHRHTDLCGRNERASDPDNLLETRNDPTRRWGRIAVGGRSTAQHVVLILHGPRC